MRVCPHCGGDLLRHGTVSYASVNAPVGVRYRCRDCRKTMLIRMKSDELKGFLRFSVEGRSNLKDWRYSA